MSLKPRITTVLTQSAVWDFYKTRRTTTVSSSKWAVPDWKAETALRMASAVEAAVGFLQGLEDLGEALVAEHLAGGVVGVDDAVREEDDEVAGPGGEGELLVLGVGEQAEGKAFGLNGLTDMACGGGGGGLLRGQRGVERADE